MMVVRKITYKDLEKINLIYSILFFIDLKAADTEKILYLNMSCIAVTFDTRDIGTYKHKTYLY